MTVLDKILKEAAQKAIEKATADIEGTAKHRLHAFSVQVETIVKAVEVDATERVLDILEKGGQVLHNTVSVEYDDPQLSLFIEGRDMFYQQNRPIKKGKYKVYFFIEPIEEGD